MSQERVFEALMSFGLTRMDAKIYVFLAKRGPQKASEVSKALKVSRQPLYRSLKSLESRGLVSATLEHPASFSALPFEKALDLLAKARMKKALEEAQQIRETKADLLANWKALIVDESKDTSAKFMVVEGKNNIYAKIQQMIAETRNQISTMTTVPSLIRADQFGMFDVGFKHPLKSKVKFRFLTQMSEQYVPAMRALLRGMSNAKLNFEGRSLELGLRLFPRLIIRDEEETILFITSKTDTATWQDNVGLWTNCKDLVQAFTATFEENWWNGTDIRQKTTELEKGKSEAKTCIVDDAVAAKKRCDVAMHSAREEIVIMTSSKGLLGSWKSIASLRECAQRGVSVKIMAPVMSGNLEAVQQLSECCEVKHVSVSHLETMIVDGKELFQFIDHSADWEKPDATSYFEKTFYTSDPPYVEKMRCVLDGIWKNASAPSAITLDSIIRPVSSPVEPLDSQNAIDEITKKDQTKLSAKDGFGGNVTIGRALVHPPKNLHLPDMMIQVHKSSKLSDFGDSDTVIFALCLPVASAVGGFSFVPVAVVDNNPRPVPMWRALFAGTPAGQNIIVVKPEQLEVWKQDDTLFAGWTIPISLVPQKYSLPPSCILFEGIGSAQHQKTTTNWPSGFKSTAEYDNLEAFVTFINPSSNYAGPGTDGSIGINVIATNIPP